MKSGPDVFADALVPRNARLLSERPRSPERSDSPRIRRAALKSPPLQIDRSQASAGLLPPVAPRRVIACEFGFRHAANFRTVAEAARFQIICWNRHCTACCAGPVTREDGIDVAAMVIVLRNRRVNRTSRLATSPSAAGTSAISRSTARCARLHPVHREP